MEYFNGVVMNRYSRFALLGALMIGSGVSSADNNLAGKNHASKATVVMQKKFDAELVQFLECEKAYQQFDSQRFNDDEAWLKAGWTKSDHGYQPKRNVKVYGHPVLEVRPLIYGLNAIVGVDAVVLAKQLKMPDEKANALGKTFHLQVKTKDTDLNHDGEKAKRIFTLGREQEAGQTVNMVGCTWLDEQDERQVKQFNKQFEEMKNFKLIVEEEQY